MRVLLDSSVLVPNWHPEVFAILSLGYLERHRVIPFDWNAFSNWINCLDEHHREMYRLVCDDSTSREAAGEARHEILVCAPARVSVVGHANALAPQESLGLLLQPYRLVLENTWNDWMFLLRMATSAERRELEQMFDKGWLVTSGGGLGELTKEVTRLKLSFASALRVAVCFDSDREYPGTVSAAAQRAEAACAGLLFICLARRSIENYIPLRSLSRWASTGPRPQQAAKRTRVAALGELKKKDPVWRNCYPMKKGFGTLPAELSSPTWVPLSEGFGKDIAAIFEHDDLVTEDDLKDDEGFGEINPFVKQLIASVR